VAIKRAVSLFSNCGAGDLGYRNASFRFDVMAELIPRRLEVCLLNHPEADGIVGDLRDTWPTVISKYRERAGSEELDLLAACPPCQGMSSARGDRGLANDPDAGTKDKRNLLAVVIAEVAKSLLPRLIVVENVPAFLTKKVRHPLTNEALSAATLLASLLESDYAVFAVLLDMCSYGVPQTRKRTFLTFVRKDLPGLDKLLDTNKSPFPKPSHANDHSGIKPVTLHEALIMLDAPSLDASSVLRARSSIAGGLHAVPVWKDRMYKMVAAIPEYSGASAWENSSCEKCGRVEVGKGDLVCPRCNEVLLRPTIIDENGAPRFIKGFRTSSYRRMRPNQPAATITTASGHIGSHFTIHPFENRLFSPLECAYLQTFPKNFQWGDALKKWGHTSIRQMIGEAVPPKFTKLHGDVLVEVLDCTISDKVISYADVRCKTASKKMNPAIL